MSYWRFNDGWLGVLRIQIFFFFIAGTYKHSSAVRLTLWWYDFWVAVQITLRKVCQHPLPLLSLPHQGKLPEESPAHTNTTSVRFLSFYVNTSSKSDHHFYVIKYNKLPEIEGTLVYLLMFCIYFKRIYYM